MYHRRRIIGELEVDETDARQIRPRVEGLSHAILGGPLRRVDVRPEHDLVHVVFATHDHGGADASLKAQQHHAMRSCWKALPAMLAHGRSFRSILSAATS